MAQICSQEGPDHCCDRIKNERNYCRYFHIWYTQNETKINHPEGTYWDTRDNRLVQPTGTRPTLTPRAATADRAAHGSGWGAQSARNRANSRSTWATSGTSRTRPDAS